MSDHPGFERYLTTSASRSLSEETQLFAYFQATTTTSHEVYVSTLALYRPDSPSLLSAPCNYSTDSFTPRRPYGQKIMMDDLFGRDAFLQQQVEQDQKRTDEKSNFQTYLHKESVN